MKVMAAGGVQICGMEWDIIQRESEIKLGIPASINGKLQSVEEAQEELERAHLEVCRPGDLTSLRWVESPALLPTPDEELCHVYNVGLNRQDMELAFGKPVGEHRQRKSMEQRYFGMEFSGRTATGKRVMGIVERALATTVLADKRFLWEVPPNWSLAYASTVPMAFFTAYYTLVVRGQLKRKQTVVVYHASSDVGLAAIALATHMDCAVYTTFGNRDQQWYTPSRFLEVPDKNSRQHWDPTFEKMVLERTGGRGADVILNQLGHDKIPAALGCLADHGNLVDIGSDLRRTDMSGISANKSFHSIDMSSITDDEKILVAGLLSEGIRQGHVSCLLYNCFSSNLVQIRQAFEKLKRNDGIGKVIVRMQSEEEPGQKIIRKKISNCL
ncbi:hypothetical protein O0L34_g10493 [Tuta absoluta]|nr:hypothetical protein O0L34_g10493 [Tuta absoluta]